MFLKSPFFYYMIFRAAQPVPERKTAPTYQVWAVRNRFPKQNLLHLTD
jgi:hypothetical protein